MLTLLLAAGLSLAEASAPPKGGAAKSTKPAAKSAKTSGKSAKVTKSSRKVRHVRRARRVRGQKAIDTNRVREIQEALARQHYLKTKPNGKWDAATQAAMRRYQADQGWQDKSVPDSRALIRLGLGPDHEHLLNPESAMTSGPFMDRGESAAGVTSSGIPAAPANSAPVSTMPDPAPSK